MRGSRLLLPVLLVAVLLAACDPSDLPGGVPGAEPAAPVCVGATDPHLDVAYGADPLQRLDVYPPPAPPEGEACAPVVVWVHGGGWQVGDKTNAMADKRRLFGDLGYVLVSVNYRLTAPGNGVVYPAHNQDVAAALAWVVAHIDEHGGDPSRLALLGHSAGAGIVASVATDAGYLGAHGLGLDAVDCVAPLDTEAFDIAVPANAGGRQQQLYRAVFGDDPVVWVDASPLTHVNPDVPPTFLVERGATSRREMLRRYAEALTDAGVAVTVVDGSTLSHAEVNRLIGADGDTVMTPPLVSWLGTCLP